MMRRGNFSSGVMVKKKSGHIKNLPYEILLDIISRLPVESVLECILVCKTWHKLLHGRRNFFKNMHASRQLNQLQRGGDKLDRGLLLAGVTDGSRQVSIFYGDSRINTDDEYDFNKTLKKVRQPTLRCFRFPQQYMVGSCNGLVCLGKYYHQRVDPIYIYNPFTGEYINLPKLIVPEGSSFPCIARGFGYVSSTDEYKVVRIFYSHRETTGQVQVYTLGSSCGWRIKCTPFPWVNVHVPGSFVDGCVYWYSGSNVYAFDLANEELRMIPSPPPCYSRAMVSFFDDYLDLVVLRGNLCFFHQTLDPPLMEIWSWKKIDTKESWCKDFSIVYEKQRKTFWPITLTKDNKIIFTKGYNTIVCYDPNTTIWKEIVPNDPHFHLGGIWVISHVNTFVSLRSLGEKSSKKNCRNKMIGKPNVGSEADV